MINMLFFSQPPREKMKQTTLTGSSSFSILFILQNSGGNLSLVALIWPSRGPNLTRQAVSPKPCLPTKDTTADELLKSLLPMFPWKARLNDGQLISADSNTH